MGAAKEISYYWEYDFEHLNEILRNSNNTLLSGLTNRESKIDFIFINGNTEIEFPSDYSQCLAPELNIYNSEDQLSSKPKLILNLKYKDVYNNNYKKIFVGELFCFHFYINIKFKMVEEIQPFVRL